MFNLDGKDSYGLLMCIQNLNSTNLKLNLQNTAEIYTYMQHYYFTKLPRSTMAARPENKMSEQELIGFHELQCLDTNEHPSVIFMQIKAYIF